MIKSLQAVGITALILLGAWIAETLIDRVRPRTPIAVRLLIFFGLGLLIFLVSIRALGAHDLPTDWIGQERRTNAEKQLCCGEGDCYPFTVDQVKVMPDGYHFPDGEVVPFNKVAPSIDNLYWICRWGGETKCAFAPLGAS
jgi:hypothetical protein